MNRILRRCKFMQKEGINMKRAKKAKAKKRNLRPAATDLRPPSASSGWKTSVSENIKNVRKKKRTRPPVGRRNTSRADSSFLKESKEKRDIKTSPSDTAKKGVLTAKKNIKKPVIPWQDHGLFVFRKESKSINIAYFANNTLHFTLFLAEKEEGFLSGRVYCKTRFCHFFCGWQDPAIAQCAQLHPQELFPFFLSLISFRVMSATIRTSAAVMRIVPMFSAIHANMTVSFQTALYAVIIWFSHRSSA